MKRIEIHAVLKVHENVDALDKDMRALMLKAIEARLDAYAPYSNFLVGCAILLENDEVVTGNNQENAAYPSGLCAERVAIFSAGARYPNIPIKALAITAGPKAFDFEKPVPPCGACRQSIAEYENKQPNSIPIFFMGTQGKVVEATSIQDLLPLVFDRDYL